MREAEELAERRIDGVRRFEKGRRGFGYIRMKDVTISLGPLVLHASSVRTFASSPTGRTDCVHFLLA